MKNKLITTLLFLIVLLPLVSAELTSTNYKIATYAIAGGGSNITSSNYKTNFLLGDISENITSNFYKLYLGYWYTTIADVTDPVMEFAGGTAADEARLWQNYTYVNVTVTEENFRSITFSLRNSTATVNTTTYATQTFSINWTGLPGEDYTYTVTVSDIASSTDTISRKITLVESEFNVSLMEGWNTIGLNMETTDTGTDRNITVVAGTGGNLISYSSSTPVSVGNILFTNTSGDQSTWAEAIAANKIYGYFAYLNPDSTAIGRDYDYAAPSELGVEDTQLREGRGYWFYSKENGILTLPSVGGTINGTTYNWADLRFRHSNGSELNITQASSAGWVLPDVNDDREYIVYYDDGQKYVCKGTGFGYPVDCKSTTLNSWTGYYIWSEYDNMILLRQN